MGKDKITKPEVEKAGTSCLSPRHGAKSPRAKPKTPLVGEGKGQSDKDSSVSPKAKPRTSLVDRQTDLSRSVSPKGRALLVGQGQTDLSRSVSPKKPTTPWVDKTDGVGVLSPPIYFAPASPLISSSNSLVSQSLSPNRRQSSGGSTAGATATATGSSISNIFFNISKMKVRPAKEKDLPVILSIQNYSIENSKTDYRYTVITLDDIKAWFNDKVAKKLPVVVCVDRDDHPVGYASYGQFRERIGFQFTVEHSIYVLNEWTGRGIGQLLMKEIIKLAKDAGLHTMIACIDSENTGSVSFHKKFGFKKCGSVKEVGKKFDQWLTMEMLQLML